MINICEHNNFDQNPLIREPVYIRSCDLPLSCPILTIGSQLPHPRVYLSISHNRHATCPYCSTKYILIE